jgi:hypothetical protein
LYWGSTQTHKLSIEEIEGGNIHVSGSTKLIEGSTCQAIVDLWLIEGKSFEELLAIDGQFWSRENFCNPSGVNPSNLKYFKIDSGRSSITFQDCEADNLVNGQFGVINAIRYDPQQDKLLTKEVQIGAGAALTDSGNDMGLSAWVDLLINGKKVSSKFYFTFECTPKETECDECDGKVTRLDLKYTGENPVEITVEDKKGDNELYIGIINPGEIFTIDGSSGIFDDKKNTLGTEIVILTDGVENTKIHTSCSQPIGPGLIFGEFTVVGGASRNGGELCPLDPPPGNGDECGECDGKVTRLDLVNDGPATQIVVTDKKGENEIFNAFVEAGATFTVKGFDKNGTLGTEIVIMANGSETKIHTSCSQPIGPGLSFGDYTVVGGASRNGGELCPLDPAPGDGDNPDEDCECDGKVDYLKFQYNGNLDDEIRVETKKEGDVFNGNVSADGTFEIFGNDKKGTLGTEIILYVNGVKHAEIHTSCSQPIGPGLIRGDFEIIGGTSRNGGDLCPL